MSNLQFSSPSNFDFFTSAHRISGQVETVGKPLRDILNDRSQSYLLVFNVYVSRLDDPGTIGAYAPTAYLSKENLTFVIVPEHQVRRPEMGRFASQEYEALVTLPGVEVRGDFLGPHRLDLRTFSPAALDAFVVLRDASARVAALPDVTFEGEAILVNRARVESFCLSD